VEIPESVYLPDGVGSDGERFVATGLARGPWDPNAQHGWRDPGGVVHVL
jgi:hypothetical protein